MTKRRVLLLGLDGFDIAVAERFLREGLLPNFARLQAEGACFDLDHGRDKYSGLAWEHVSSGVRPADGGRWSAVSFNKSTYQATQEHTRVRPFLANVAAKAVIFDVPYFDLTLAPNVRGLTAWGAHDPGVAPAARPSGLHEEITKRFGKYPAPEWIYGFCWPSAEKARAAGEALTKAVETRAQAARWLLKERLPDWDLGIVVVSEGHSAIEPMWHGVDDNHPLHGLDSARPAGMGLRKVYAAMDQLIGDLRESFPDATLVLLAMHGMGPNGSDVPAMVLLPELLYRNAFGRPYMRPVEFAKTLPDGTPVLEENQTWSHPLYKAIPGFQPNLYRRIVRRAKSVLGWNGEGATAVDLDWMPAAAYSRFWPQMQAFALPSYYDGRVRLNVTGREQRGIIPAREYVKACRKIRDLVGECRNVLNGKRVAAEIYCPNQDPHKVGASEADVYIVWEGAPLGISHPRLGSIGPACYMRTGGHTGERGFLNIVGSEIPRGQHGLVSSFDVVPTIIELLGEPCPAGVSGRSLAQGKLS